MIALDALEQMHAEPFELIGADARVKRPAGLIQIRSISSSPSRRMVIRATLTSANNILPSRTTATAECKFMGVAGERAQLLRAPGRGRRAC